MELDIQIPKGNNSHKKSEAVSEWSSTKQLVVKIYELYL